MPWTLFGRNGERQHVFEQLRHIQHLEVVSPYSKIFCDGLASRQTCLSPRGLPPREVPRLKERLRIYLRIRFRVRFTELRLNRESRSVGAPQEHIEVRLSANACRKPLLEREVRKRTADGERAGKRFKRTRTPV